MITVCWQWLQCGSCKLCSNFDGCRSDVAVDDDDGSGNGNGNDGGGGGNSATRLMCWSVWRKMLVKSELSLFFLFLYLSVFALNLSYIPWPLTTVTVNCWQLNRLSVRLTDFNWLSFSLSLSFSVRDFKIVVLSFSLPLFLSSSLPFFLPPNQLLTTCFSLSLSLSF